MMKNDGEKRPPAKIAVFAKQLRQHLTKGWSGIQQTDIIKKATEE